MLENRRHGIFALCDERLKLKATVSHEVFAKDLYAKCMSSPHFVAEAAHQRNHQFMMRHFAGDVVYDTQLFLEKNRSEVAIELTRCLKESSSPFVRELAETFEGVEEVLASQAQPRPPSLRVTAANNSPLRSTYSDGGVGMERRLSPRRLKPFEGTYETPLKLTTGKFQGAEKRVVESNAVPSSAGASVKPLHVSTPSTSTDTPLQSGQQSSRYNRSGSTGMGAATRGALMAGQSPKLAPLRRKRIQTVLSQFTKQLQDLMDSVKLTRSHFIRCIKPNALMSSGIFDTKLVMDQLRCGGVHGAVQVFRAGFPNRFDFSYFVAKYSSFAFVCGQNSLTSDFYQLRSRSETTDHYVYWKACCRALMQIVPVADAILTALGIEAVGMGGLKGGNTSGMGTYADILDVDAMIRRPIHTSVTDTTTDSSTSDGVHDLKKIIEEGMCMGRSQVFLRAQVFEYLEQLQLRAHTLIASVVQVRWRSYQRVKLNTVASRSKASTVRIAMAVESFAARRRRTAIHITAAVITLQRRARVYIACRRLSLARYLSTWVSAHYRGALVRQYVYRLRYKMAATIQAQWRGRLQRHRHVVLRSCAVKVQRWVRRVKDRLWMRRELDCQVLNDACHRCCCCCIHYNLM